MSGWKAIPDVYYPICCGWQTVGSLRDFGMVFFLSLDSTKILSKWSPNNYSTRKGNAKTICFECVSACQALSQMPLLATVAKTMALEVNIMASSVASAVKEPALSILEASSRSLVSAAAAFFASIILMI